jgi:excisionase family DNA binding protein
MTIEEIKATLPREYSTKETAQLLGCSKDTVLAYIRGGVLKARDAATPGSSRKMWRVSDESIRALVSSHQAQAPPMKRAKETRRRIKPVPQHFRHLNFD